MVTHLYDYLVIHIFSKSEAEENVNKQKDYENTVRRHKTSK